MGREREPSPTQASETTHPTPQRGQEALRLFVEGTYSNENPIMVSVGMCVHQQCVMRLGSCSGRKSRNSPHPRLSARASVCFGFQVS
jgi:hypothetical protein